MTPVTMVTTKKIINVKNFFAEKIFGVSWNETEKKFTYDIFLLVTMVTW